MNISLFDSSMYRSYYETIVIFVCVCVCVSTEREGGGRGHCALGKRLMGGALPAVHSAGTRAHRTTTARRLGLFLQRKERMASCATAAAAATPGGVGPTVARATRLVASLIKEYSGRNPTAERAIRVLSDQTKDSVSWDHLAFRTWGHQRNCIATLSPIFASLGYEKKGELEFTQKRLRAQWYAPADAAAYEVLPRIFISELKLEEQSEEVRAIVSKYCESIPADGELADEEMMCGKALPWKAPVLKDDFEYLAKESGEYAAWVLTNGYALNHTTVSAHRLGDGYTMERMVEMLEANGFAMNDSGGVIKVSADGGLRQSSTVADNKDFVFAGDVQEKVPGSYIEFAERLPQPGKDAKATRECDLRDGFETASADRIFESTTLSQAR